MENARRLAVFVVFVAAMLFALQGCGFLDKITGKAPAGTEQKPAESSGTTTQPVGQTDGADETTPPEETHIAKITSPLDNATGVDTKLPLEWWVDPNAGKVTMVAVNIFEYVNGEPANTAVAIFKNVMDASICDARKWTLFEKDIDKNWIMQGDLAGKTELKANTKYLMNFVISTDGGKNETVQLHFTTK